MDSSLKLSRGALLQHYLAATGVTPVMSFANYANSSFEDQSKQVRRMIDQGAKIIIIEPDYSVSFGAVLARAKKAGVTVIVIDWLPEKTGDVDVFIGFSACQAGELQGQALLAGLAVKENGPPWNIELFAGSADTEPAVELFRCAMKVLQPKIYDGTLNVLSGETSLEQAATKDWVPDHAVERLNRLLSQFYQSQAVLDGVLTPNGTIARDVVGVAAASGLPQPVVTGMGSQPESINWIAQGKQHSTIFFSDKTLVFEVVKIVKKLLQGEGLTFNSEVTSGVGEAVVPAYLLTPQLVTRGNLCSGYDLGTEEAQVVAKTGVC